MTKILNTVNRGRFSLLAGHYSPFRKTSHCELVLDLLAITRGSGSFHSYMGVSDFITRVEVPLWNSVQDAMGAPTGE